MMMMLVLVLMLIVMITMVVMMMMMIYCKSLGQTVGHATLATFVKSR